MVPGASCRPILGIAPRKRASRARAGLSTMVGIDPVVAGDPHRPDGHRMPPRIARTRDRGFTLVELIVVVLILGILTAIAIPVYIGQQRSAQDAAAQSDLEGARVAMKAYSTRYGGATTTNVATLAAFGYVVSSGVSMSVRSTSGSTFCIEAVSASGAHFATSDSASVAAGTC